MTGFVLDASVTCAWVFADEATPPIDQLLDQTIAGGVIVPPLWRSEVLNTLIQASRRDRITVTQINNLWNQLERLPITETTHRPEAAIIVNLSLKHNLTAYDACYLELALWQHLPLATLDQALITAATATGTPLLGQG
ncbi:MAG: type II toxin-antitoxin system VapC family toxin [Propionibacteriaceae bacterium]|jgi:predicted nucleic acid-binding protein|nr:type II toxin-antitoxin system VapC family toxin [Propionibacteriaceae bacterium]